MENDDQCLKLIKQLIKSEIILKNIDTKSTSSYDLSQEKPLMETEL